MDKKLLLDIINNGVDEIKGITGDFKTNNPSKEEIDITIKKTEILLKELHLLNNSSEDNSKNTIKAETKAEQKDPIKTKEVQKASEDIRNLIGINDKFLFIRELFNGDTNRYSETIDRLNNTNTLIEAQGIIPSHNWDKEEESTKLFFEILNRKFI